jgi:hypothetical protein
LVLEERAARHSDVQRHTGHRMRAAICDSELKRRPRARSGRNRRLARGGCGEIGRNCVRLHSAEPRGSQHSPACARIEFQILTRSLRTAGDFGPGTALVVRACRYSVMALVNARGVGGKPHIIAARKRQTNPGRAAVRRLENTGRGRVDRSGVSRRAKIEQVPDKGICNDPRIGSCPSESRIDRLVNVPGICKVRDARMPECDFGDDRVRPNARGGAPVLAAIDRSQNAVVCGDQTPPVPVARVK